MTTATGVATVITAATAAATPSPIGEVAAATARPKKIPVSVLVVVHTAVLQVLLIERADRPGFWQSVTGSLDALDEPLLATARREVREETGIDADAAGTWLTDWQHRNRYEIFATWRHRYADGVTHNVEHVFGLCVPAATEVVLSPREHRDFVWLPWAEAADRCFSPSNAAAIRELPRRAAAVADAGDPSAVAGGAAARAAADASMTPSARDR